MNVQNMNATTATKNYANLLPKTTLERWRNAQDDETKTDCLGQKGQNYRRGENLSSFIEQPQKSRVIDSHRYVSYSRTAFWIVSLKATVEQKR